MLQRLVENFCDVVARKVVEVNFKCFKAAIQCTALCHFGGLCSENQSENIALSQIPSVEMDFKVNDAKEEKVNLLN